MRDMKNLQDFTKEDYALMDEIHDEMISKVMLNDTSDETLIKAVKTIYDLGGEKEPEVTVCASPLDMKNRAKEFSDDTSESWYGNIGDFYWIAYAMFGIKADITEDDKDFQRIKEAIVDSGIWSMIALEGKAFVCRRPISLNTDSENEMHCMTGKAVEWPDEEVDGKRVRCGSHFIHGVYFKPEDYWKAVKATATEVINWPDIEQRSVLLRERPVSELLKECESKVVSRSEEFGGYELHEIEVAGLGTAKVLTFKGWSSGHDYAHFVPKESTDAITSVATMFGLTVDEFRAAHKDDKDFPEDKPIEGKRRHVIHGDIVLNPCDVQPINGSEVKEAAVQVSPITGNSHVVGGKAVYHWKDEGKEYVCAATDAFIEHRGPSSEHGKVSIDGTYEVTHQVEFDAIKQELRSVID
ncbi:MAG: hypothetical protein WC455_10415 [Dehalococcoidia bacterium]